MLKLKQVIAIVVTLLVSNSIFAINKVVYGTDDRRDVYQVSNPMYLELSRSTAAMIDKKKLSKLGDKTVITGKTLNSRGICKNQRFAQQGTAANCSGFLVAPDILVTAGHCYKKAKSACEKFMWVFDYKYDSSDITKDIKVDNSKVYGCKEVISQVLDGKRDDYAVIRLDRKVEDRQSLKLRTEGEIERGQNIVVIGHPTGLPTKVADNAFVRDTSSPIFFRTNLDTFGGNSGSAVFDSETGIVEGILVRGEQDYKTDWTQGGCKVVNECLDDACRGEDVTRITNVAHILSEL